MKNRRKD